MEFSVIDPQEELTTHLVNNDKVIILFGAKWCKNCSKLCDHVLASNQLSNIRLIKVDIDESADIADSYGVSVLPHVAFIYRGDVVRNYVGSDIDKFVEYYIELDGINMDNVDVVSSSKSRGSDATGAVEPTLFAIQELPPDFVPVQKKFPCRNISFEILNCIGLRTLSVSAQDVYSARERGIVGSSQSSYAAVDPQTLFVYRVPMVSEDGTCSKADMLAKRPFNLATDAYHIATEADWDPAQFAHHSITKRLAFLKEVVARLNHVINADWLGIYRLVLADGEPALLKEAYCGEPSRPVFPVTASFAAKSTNSWVGLTGNARIIENTRVRDGSVSYYECSSKVQSELCVPIFGAWDAATETCPVMGIIDVESWNPAHFTADRVMEVLQVSLDLGEINFGICNSWSHS